MVDNDPQSAGGASAGFLCSDMELAQKLKAALTVLQIPSVAHARPDGRGILAVPSEFAQKASQALSSAPGIVLEQGPEPYIRKYDAAKDQTVYDHPVLKLAIPDLKKRGAEALDELYHCVVKGSPQVAERSIMTLGRLGKDAHSTLDRLAVIGVQMGNAPFVGLLIREGKILEGRAGAQLPELLRPMLNLLKNQNANVRQQAVRLLGGLRITECVAPLADAMLDSSDDVAIEADDAFLHWGAKDERFEPDLSRDEKLAIVERRRAFRPKS